MKELVSIIISTYKREHELERAINSVLNQTYENYEIIIVDDNGRGSKEQQLTEKIIEKYKNHKNIRYICNEVNLGGSLARNAGIYIAKGEYIAFLDDDDQYYPKKLEEQMKLFKYESNPKLALVYCYTDSYNEDNKLIDTYRNDYIGNCLVDAMKTCIAATSQWLCKKDFLIDVGCFSDVPSKQDCNLIIKLLSKGYEVNRVPEVLVRYNEHSNERISSGSTKNILGEVLLRDLCRNLYSKVESSDIIDIESSFSYRLSKLYVKNKIYDKFNIEMKTLKSVSKKHWLKLNLYYHLKNKNINIS